MITESKVIANLSEIKKFCNEHRCSECPFLKEYRWGEHCAIAMATCDGGDYTPDNWDLKELEGE